MDRITRAEIESSVDSFPDLDYQFEHIDWADIMDAEEASNPELKLQVLQQKSYLLHSDKIIGTVSQSGMPALNSLKLDDHSRGAKNRNVPALVSFSGVLKKKAGTSIGNSSSRILNDPPPTNTAPLDKSKGVFKVPALPRQMGKRSLEDLGQFADSERKAIRPPPSPSSVYENKRLKFSKNCRNRDWKYGDDDFIFTSGSDWRPTPQYDSILLPIPHSPSVSTLESDTEIETSSAYSDTSSTYTLTNKRSRNKKEELPPITDVHKLAQRQKQIDYGKNTDGYKNYIKQHPKFDRKPGMPTTPDKQIGYSHRRWLGLVTKWRKLLHKWDVTENASILPSIRSEEFHVHLEDANFPLNTQTAADNAENPTVFSYSFVSQMLHEKSDQNPLPPPREANIFHGAISNRNNDVFVPNPVQPASLSPQPLSYSSVLKAPKHVHPVQIPQADRASELIDPEENIRDNNVEDIDENEDIGSKENIPPPQDATPSPKLSYSQVLAAAAPKKTPETPKDLNQPTSHTPIEPEIINEQKTDLDDSMEVDTPQNEIIEIAPLPISPPLTYSQALRSKPLVNPGPFDPQVNHIEFRNEQTNNYKQTDNNEEKCTEVISNELPKKSELSTFTYSQVLTGKTVDKPSARGDVTFNGICKESQISAENTVREKS